MSLSPESSVQVPGLDRWIFCGGMLRAGSTLQYQIASELIERSGLGVRSPYADPMSHEGALQAAVPKGISRTFKSHALTPSIMERLADGNAVALYSFRDLRDVIASQQQKNGWSLGERDLRALVADLLATDSAWRSLPRVHVVRYESMVTRLLEEVLDSHWQNRSPPTSHTRRSCAALRRSLARAGCMWIPTMSTTSTRCSTAITCSPAARGAFARCWHRFRSPSSSWSQVIGSPTTDMALQAES